MAGGVPEAGGSRHLGGASGSLVELGESDLRAVGGRPTSRRLCSTAWGMVWPRRRSRWRSRVAFSRSAAAWWQKVRTSQVQVVSKSQEFECSLQSEMLQDSSRTSAVRVKLVGAFSSSASSRDFATNGLAAAMISSSKRVRHEPFERKSASCTNESCKRG